jgi:hypothetical protein
MEEAQCHQTEYVFDQAPLMPFVDDGRRSVQQWYWYRCRWKLGSNGWRLSCCQMSIFVMSLCQICCCLLLLTMRLNLQLNSSQLTSPPSLGIMECPRLAPAVVDE